MLAVPAIGDQYQHLTYSMKMILRILGTITIVVMLVLGSTSAVAQDGVSVSVNAPGNVTENSTFAAEVDIADVVDFDAGNFDVSYDESVLQLDNVTAGRIGMIQIPVAIWNMMDANTCRVVVNVPDVPGVNGSGYLAVLRFHVIGAAGDSSVIALSNGFLNNTQPEEIPATWTGDSVEVREKGDDPESPATKILIGAFSGVVLACLAGYLWLRSRRTQKA